jgi:hypothetical protein
VKADRIEALARDLADREAERVSARQEARELAGVLHDGVTEAVSRFASTVRDGGAAHLDLLHVDPI